MAASTYDFKVIEKSIRDLTRVYKPKPENVDTFVLKFIKKYPASKGYRKELIKIVLNEIDNINN